mmetsp:Transcript_39178/g.59775  ORF Transcript_39178/g.59775 Transcript_39178/m.59775 type:complete len:202 (+) Transcript_39178:1931-2536(+)
MCSILIHLNKFCEKWLQSAGGDIRKGMVLLDYKDKINVQACFSFKADIWSLDGTTQTIKQTFQPFIHTQQVAQSCAIFLEGDSEMVRYLDLKKFRLKNKKKRRGKSIEVQNEDTSDKSETEKEGKVSNHLQSKAHAFQDMASPEQVLLRNKLKQGVQGKEGLAGRQRAYSSHFDLLTQKPAGLPYPDGIIEEGAELNKTVE